ncbi:ferredoxin [Nocardiopsis halotolerans]|uniref:ferredoxin n=1 Tax=Nocardiopsis halotolerans TaxID=124252 RepID=UPI000347718A|nr:ferredoxin [Nocardiopsis halotolerans]
MRVRIDYDQCESNALCMAAAPEVFEVRDDDFLHLLTEEPDTASHEHVRQAERMCPKRAITVLES